jgi:DNA-directed RNA polymerase specialized sigma24 family protein
MAPPRQSGAESRPERGAISAEEELPTLLESLRPAFRSTFRTLRVAPAESEDLLQTLALVYLLQAGTIRNRRAWLRGALLKLCLLHHRRRERLDRAHRLFAAGTSGLCEPSFQELEVRARLSRLPRRSRRALELHYLEGFSLAETADLLGYRGTSLKRTLNRALRQAGD